MPGFFYPLRIPSKDLLYRNPYQDRLPNSGVEFRAHGWAHEVTDPTGTDSKRMTAHLARRMGILLALGVAVGSFRHLQGWHVA